MLTGEPRFVPLAKIRFSDHFDATGKLLAVAHTYQITGPTNVRVRVISARKATRRERRFYEDEPR
jgi:uncharacterized DUF497 family protein